MYKNSSHRLFYFKLWTYDQFTYLYLGSVHIKVLVKLNKSRYLAFKFQLSLQIYETFLIEIIEFMIATISNAHFTSRNKMNHLIKRKLMDTIIC